MYSRSPAESGRRVSLDGSIANENQLQRISWSRLISIAKCRGDLLGGGLAAGDALGDADAAIGVAGERECGNAGDKLLDAGNSVQVADVVLRHRARPAGDVGDERHAGDLQEFGQFVVSDAAEFGVGQVEQLGLQRAADEDADQDVVGRRTARVLQAGETAGDDSAVLGLRHDEAEAIERVADLTAVKTEADDGAAGVFDRCEFRGDVGMRRIQQLRGGMGGDGDDDGVECRLRISDFGLRIESELPLAVLSIDARDICVEVDCIVRKSIGEFCHQALQAVLRSQEKAVAGAAGRVIGVRCVGAWRGAGCCACARIRRTAAWWPPC